MSKEKDDVFEVNDGSVPSLKENFIFKEEITRLMEEERDKCIRSILWTIEVVLKNRNTEDFTNLRKSVLDSVNDFYRKINTYFETNVF